MVNKHISGPVKLDQLKVPVSSHQIERWCICFKRHLFCFFLRFFYWILQLDFIEVYPSISTPSWTFCQSYWLWREEFILLAVIWWWWCWWPLSTKSSAFSLIYSVLAHLPNSLWVDMSLLLETFSWFRDESQSLPFQPNTKCLVGKQTILILQVLAWSKRSSIQRFITPQTITQTITSPMRSPKAIYFD